MLHHFIVGERGEHDARFLGDLARGVAPLQTVLDQAPSAVLSPGRAEHGVAGGEEPRGHVAAHVAEADEAHALLARRGCHHVISLFAGKTHPHRI